MLASIMMCLVSQQAPQYHSIKYDTPAMTWDEGLPLGNGLLGALVWGDGAPLNVSLDRTDLWDLRPIPEYSGPDYKYRTMRKWVQEGRIQDLWNLYDKPYETYPGPTKIPAGRIQIDIPRFKISERSLTYELQTGTGEVDSVLSNDSSVKVFIDQEKPVGRISFSNTRHGVPKLIVPEYQGKDEQKNADLFNIELAALGYPAPRIVNGQNWTGYEQEGWGGFKFAVCVMWQETESGLDHVIWSVTTNEDTDKPLEQAVAYCRDALEEDWNDTLDRNRNWWKNYWAKSSVQVPDETLQKLWYEEMYKFGAATRPDTPPITLQGPWTADTGKIPPWRGDYHHDLNTELSYWPAYAGNHLDSAEGFVNWLWETKDGSKEWTERFFELPGLNVPMTGDLNNDQIGGWHQYTHSSTTAAWLAHHFWLQWRYTMDRKFLRERAYPYLKDVSVFMEFVTEVGEDGKRTLPLSSSPEINDNRLDAWFPTITNYDLALISWVWEHTAILAMEVGDQKEAAHLRKLIAELPEFAIDETTEKLLVADDYPLASSHRHFSHLLAIHPLGLIDWNDGPRARRVIRASLNDLEKLGTDYWTGYSFSWLASMYARARDGESAAQALHTFATAFRLRNSFHVNGDQSGKGYSKFTYRPFTLEGNFAAAAGLMEMLIQSHAGVVRLFPAIPADWENCSFRSLRAEGAFLVSAKREGRRTVWVEIVSEKGGQLVLESPFDGEYSSAGVDVATSGRNLIIKFKPGERVVFKAEE